jgi:hypothetical protein
MATLQMELTRRGGLAAAFAGMALLAGCVSTDKAPDVVEAPPPPCGGACQIAARWQPQVYWTPDPTRNGALNPTLAGRVYLFGPDVGFSLVGDGSMVVSLYEGSPGPGVEAQPLEIWNIDPVSLKKYLKKDAIGWGYTVCLPWSTYRKDLTRVQMRVRYDTTPGQAPLFAENSPLTLNPDPNAAAPAITQGSRSPINALPASSVPVAFGLKP